MNKTENKKKEDILKKAKKIVSVQGWSSEIFSKLQKQNIEKNDLFFSKTFLIISILKCLIWISSSATRKVLKDVLMAYLKIFKKLGLSERKVPKTNITKVA